jgi:predicted Zn-dependent peptidase
VNKGNMAYQIVSISDPSRLYNNYAVHDIVMQAQVGNAKVKKAISKEIYGIINEGIDQQLLDDYVRNREAADVFLNYSSSGIAGMLGFAEYYYNDYSKYDAQLKAYRAIKAEELTAIAKKYFNPETIRVINIKPNME